MLTLKSTITIPHNAETYPSHWSVELVILLHLLAQHLMVVLIQGTLLVDHGLIHSNHNTFWPLRRIRVN